MRIENGRSYFYQWELNQQLIVEEDCTRVEFDNGTQPKALCCKVKNEDGTKVVDVPNLLLQTAADLHAYAWDEAKRCVVRHQVFGVEGRTRPDDYVYTQTEVLCYKELAEMATNIAQQAAESARETERFAGESLTYAQVAVTQAGQAAKAAENAKQDAARAQSVVDAYNNGELNGKTPVRGVDYWTKEDKSQIEGYIDSKIPSGSILQATLEEEW